MTIQRLLCPASSHPGGRRSILVDSFTLVLIMILILAVAFLYSSVGHGGASGYLAVLALVAFEPLAMATTVLVMNVLVTAVGFFMYRTAGHFRWSLIWPFLIGSLPASYLGGSLALSGPLYALLLALLLGFAAVRLLWPGAETTDSPGPPAGLVSLGVGGGIGFVAGTIGIGGGIFLSPLLILFNWADAKTTAAVSTVFVGLNSVFGLLGRWWADALVLGEFAYFIPAALVGGLIGSGLGANYFSGRSIKLLLSVVLLIASLKLFQEALMNGLIG